MGIVSFCSIWQSCGMHLNNQFREQIALNLANFATATLPHEDNRAAVVVLLNEAGLGADVKGLPMTTQWSDAPAILLTRRALTLRNHPGQWAIAAFVQARHLTNS